MMSKKESGFTLIEIVMVLVLLGILLAVAAPKYFDLQKEARQQATNAIVAEVQSRLNAEFASQLLNGKTCAVAKTNALSSLSAETASGDYAGNKVTSADSAWTVEVGSVTDGAKTVSVTVTWGSGSDADEQPPIDIQLPECN